MGREGKDAKSCPRRYVHKNHVMYTYGRSVQTTLYSDGSSFLKKRKDSRLARNEANPPRPGGEVGFARSLACLLCLVVPHYQTTHTILFWAQPHTHTMASYGGGTSNEGHSRMSIASLLSWNGMGDQVVVE